MNQLLQSRKRYLDGEYVHMPQIESSLGAGRVLRLGDPRYVKFISDFIEARLYVVYEQPIHTRLSVFGVRPTAYSSEGLGIQLKVPGVNNLRLDALMKDSVMDLTFDDDSIELTVKRSQPNCNEQMHDFVSEFAPEPIRQSAGAILNFANLMAYYLND